MSGAGGDESRAYLRTSLLPRLREHVACLQNYELRQNTASANNACSASVQKELEEEPDGRRRSDPAAWRGSCTTRKANGRSKSGAAAPVQTPATEPTDAPLHPPVAPPPSAEIEQFETCNHGLRILVAPPLTDVKRTLLRILVTPSNLVRASYCSVYPLSHSMR